MEITPFVYPIDWEDQKKLISLWRTEWRQTEVRWLDAMNGDYCNTITICSLLGVVDHIPVGTATVYYAREKPEVCLIGSVLTHESIRRMGIGRLITDAAAKFGYNAGCKVAYLGASRRPDSVYLKCGFQWWYGSVMRRAASPDVECETEIFKAGQTVVRRNASWGDMPGVACFALQPIGTFVIDYPRSLISVKYAESKFCVSNFPLVWYDLEARGGFLRVVAVQDSHRILGFGTVTPERTPHRKHVAVLDVAIHDNYLSQFDPLVSELIAQASDRGIDRLYAYLAAPDRLKAKALRTAGFRRLSKLTDQLRIQDAKYDVTIYERILSNGL